MSPHFLSVILTLTFPVTFPKKRLLQKYFGYFNEMRNPKRFQKVWISCVDGSVITAFHSVCESVRSPLCTVQEFWRVGGNNKPPCVFRKGAGGGGVAHRGIFGIVQHHSSLVQDTFFPEVWPLCQTNHCQRKGDHHTLDEKEARTKKKSQKNLHTGGGGWSATQPATALISINGCSR